MSGTRPLAEIERARIRRAYGIEGRMPDAATVVPPGASGIRRPDGPALPYSEFHKKAIWRAAAQKQARRRMVEAMRANGLTVARMAEALGVSTTTIANDLRDLRAGAWQ